MSRYIPTYIPEISKWVIHDLELRGFCTLPDKEDPSSLIPLEWDSRPAAEGWLRQCYQQWYVWESRGKPQDVTIPERWRPLRVA